MRPKLHVILTLATRRAEKLRDQMERDTTEFTASVNVMFTTVSESSELSNALSIASDITIVISHGGSWRNDDQWRIGIGDMRQQKTSERLAAVEQLAAATPQRLLVLDACNSRKAVDTWPSENNPRRIAVAVSEVEDKHSRVLIRSLCSALQEGYTEADQIWEYATNRAGAGALSERYSLAVVGQND